MKLRRKTIITKFSSMALRHLWIVWVALWVAWCRFGIRASLGWPPVQTSHCRTRRIRSTWTSWSACRWTPWPTSHARMAWRSKRDPCRWIPAADGRWTGCSPRALRPAFRLLEPRLVPEPGWREATWWTAIHIAGESMLQSVFAAWRPAVRSVRQRHALQSNNPQILNKKIVSTGRQNLTETGGVAVVQRWLLTSWCAC